MSFALPLNSLSLQNVGCEIDDRVLFRSLSAQLNPGEMVQIAGPNGAGKTTLLRIIAGLSSNYAGELAWGAYNIPSYEFYCALLYLGHSTGIKSALTPLENLRWYFGLNGLKRSADAAQSHSSMPSDAHYRQALVEVGLGGYEDIPCYHMSAGQKRRAALARLYVSCAPLWILDEPLTAIDKAGVLTLERCFHTHLSRGGILVMTSHQDMSAAKPRVIDLADYVEGEQG